MSLIEFLMDLEKAFEAELAKVPIDGRWINGAPGPDVAMEVSIGHIRALVFEAKRAPEKRTASVIRSSWAMVRKTGAGAGIFKKYKGDERLRNELRAFLDGTTRGPAESASHGLPLA